MPYTSEVHCPTYFIAVYHKYANEVSSVRIKSNCILRAECMCFINHPVRIRRLSSTAFKSYRCVVCYVDCTCIQKSACQKYCLNLQHPDSHSHANFEVNSDIIYHEKRRRKLHWDHYNYPAGQVFVLDPYAAWKTLANKDVIKYFRPSAALAPGYVILLKDPSRCIVHTLTSTCDFCLAWQGI